MLRILRLYKRPNHAHSVSRLTVLTSKFKILEIFSGSNRSEGAPSSFAIEPNITKRSRNYSARHKSLGTSPADANGARSGEPCAIWRWRLD